MIDVRRKLIAYHDRIRREKNGFKHDKDIHRVSDRCEADMLTLEERIKAHRRRIAEHERLTIQRKRLYSL